ncbi:MAG TPA: EamA family transporter [Candidatus Dormibacteraeota bacterium]
MASNRLDWRVWTALGTVYLVWGSTYLAIRIVDRGLPPLYSAAARFLLAGALLLALAALSGGLRGVSWRGIGLAAVPGVLLITFGNGAVMLAERTLQSSLAALIVALSPLVMALIVMALDRRLVAARAGAGLLIGFAGLVLLVRPQPGSHVDLVGTGIIIAGTVAWAAGSVFAGKRPTGMAPLATSAFQMLVGGAVLAVVAPLSGEQLPTSLAPSAVPSLWALVYLLAIGAVVGYTAYSWLLSRAPLSIVSTYAYVNPVVAIALGVLLLNEQFSLGEAIASVVILAGVALIVSARTARKPVVLRDSAAA